MSIELFNVLVDGMVHKCNKEDTRALLLRGLESSNDSLVSRIGSLIRHWPQRVVRESEECLFTETQLRLLLIDSIEVTLPEIVECTPQSEWGAQPDTGRYMHWGVNLPGHNPFSTLTIRPGRVRLKPFWDGPVFWNILEGLVGTSLIGAFLKITRAISTLDSLGDFPRLTPDEQEVLAGVVTARKYYKRDHVSVLEVLAVVKGTQVNMQWESSTFDADRKWLEAQLANLAEVKLDLLKEELAQVPNFPAAEPNRFQLAAMAVKEQQGPAETPLHPESGLWNTKEIWFQPFAMAYRPVSRWPTKPHR